MKKVILDLAVSLDGFIEGPNGEIDWCIMDDDMDFDGFISSIDTIFYGRVSYDTWGNYQPDIKENPFLHTPSRTVPKTEMHQVFKDGHFITIMDSLKADPYTDFFCKAIYYICIRPKELRELQLKHIDLDRGTIFIPSHISKNKKDGYVHIDPNFKKELDKLNIIVRMKAFI